MLFLVNNQLSTKSKGATLLIIIITAGIIYSNLKRINRRCLIKNQLQ